MNIEYLKTFQEIARLNSFSEVAKKLHISQPAVSFQIQKLEQELGVQLIDRSQRSLALTEAGKRLLRFAVVVDGERDKLRGDLENLKEEISGDLLIGASTIPGEYILPPFLARFKSLHPAVNVQVEISDSLTVIDRVRSNDYEVGFCGTGPESKDLESFVIAGDEIVLLVNFEHPFATKNEITPDELEGQPFIFREATSGTQRSLESSLAKNGIPLSKLTPRLVLGSTQAVISAVMVGAGIGFMSSQAVRLGCPPGLKVVKIHGLQMKRDFYCICRRDKAMNRLNAEFKTFIRLETSGDD